MRFSRLLVIAFTYILFIENASAQSFSMYAAANGAKVLAPKGDTLRNAWAGGMDKPQFSNIDLNQDPCADLFVFERIDDKISLFIGLAGGGFEYRPEYEKMFPAVRVWALLLDYNKDGKEDIFTFSR